MSRTILRCALALVVAASQAAVVELDASRGGHASRGAARSSVHRSAAHVNRDVGRNVNRDISRNVNVDRNVRRDVDIDRDIDFDRDIDIDVDRYGGWGYGCCYHPVARAATATAAAVTTAAVVGSVVNSIPASCEAVIVNGFTYQQCGSTWYRPQFYGSTVTYVVVSPPR
jgi:hypothetical protein